MLVSMKEICQRAKEGHYGVPALASGNEHIVRSAIEAAEEKNSPLILLCNVKAPDFQYLGKVINDLAAQSRVPVAAILDHGPSYESAVLAVKANLTDIMIDKSSEPYEVNVAETKRVCELAHAAGMYVEAELGHVGNADNYEEDGHTAFTDPDTAIKFVEETGVDFLAVAVGTAHGAYPKGMKPEIQFELLKELRDKVPVPLVLHGGSGSGDENIAEACRLGITKVNLANDLYQGCIKEVLEHDWSSGWAAYGFYGVVAEGYKKVAKHYFDVCGSTGKAWTKEPKGLTSKAETETNKEG